VNPRTGLDAVEMRKFLTLPGLELRSLRRLAHSHSLRYSGSNVCLENMQYFSGKLEGNKSFGRPRHRCQNNINLNLETVCTAFT
jgi:hypothetical protein